MTAPPPAAPLEAHALSVVLGGRTVLDRVGLRLEARLWTAIVGPNGAGKSTLLAALAGLRAPAAGTVRLDGRTLGAWSPRERAMRIAWLGQHGEAEGDLAARDVVALGRLPRLGLLGSPGSSDDAIVDAAMRETECDAFAGRRLDALSGGERQRVLIARALAVDAGVLLLDEPTTHLDAPHQRALLRSLRARTARGAAIATVLHDLGLAMAADRLLVLVAGRVAADGPPADPAVRDALVRAFGGAIRILRVADEPDPSGMPDGAGAADPSAAPDAAAGAARTDGRWIVVPRD
ncbi:MAG: ABC transporter ATP-binding protein [Burkholderiales bacterium]|nr:MAG: ABC transporter ATP-binding protein [Burkholderiales bacterium]